MARADTRSAVGSATLVLLIANAALAGLAWLALTTDLSTAPAPMPSDRPAVQASDRAAATARATPAPTTEIAPLPDAAKLNQTRERPLFRPDRRPPKSEVAAPLPPSPADATPPALPTTSLALPSDLKLVGIIAMPGQRRRAVFRQGDPRASVSLETGERIGDWRVTEIRAESVILEAGRQRHVLQLYQPSAASTGSQRN